MTKRIITIILTAAVSLLFFSCPMDSPPSNHAPVIQSLTASKTSCDYGESVTITAVVSDSDGDTITYTWSATDGDIVDNNSIATWTAPNTAGNEVITLQAFDGEKTVSDSVSIRVGTEAFSISQFTAQAEDSKIELTWNNPTFSNFAGVEIRRKTEEYPESRTEGDLICKTSDNSYTDIGLSNGVKYYYQGWVYDQQGNYQALGSTAAGIPSKTDDDGNNEDIVNDSGIMTIESIQLNRAPYKGETILMQLGLKNNGTVNYSNVQALISTSSTYATIQQNTDSGYYDINAGETDFGSSPGVMKFTIGTNAPPMEEIIFPVTISSSNGGPWTGTVRIVVKPTEAYPQYLSHQLTQEVSGNGNSQINPGEIIRFTCSIMNSGSAEAGGVTAQLTSTSGSVSITDNSDTYGLLPGGMISSGTGNGYEVSFSSSLNHEDEVPFRLAISDEDGNSWNSDFTIQILDNPGTVVITAAVVGDDIGGDDDNQIDPGETVGIYVTLKNQGSSLVRNVTGILSTSETGVTISVNNDTYGDIAVNATDSGTNTIPWGYRFSVDAGVASGTALDFNLQITDTDSHQWDDAFTLTVQ